MTQVGAGARTEALGFDEVIPPGEGEAMARVVQTIEGRVREAAKSAPARRDAHPKSHGCVHADFRVLDTVPSALRAGVFAVPLTFKAWIRFSNGSEKPGPDGRGDGRGMAVKLLGVEGSPSTTQCFWWGFYFPN